MSTMENVRYRVANDQFEPNTYYVDTGYMYIEQDLTTGEVRNVTDAYNGGQEALAYPTQRPLAITSGSRPGSVIMSRHEPVVVEDPAMLRRSTVVPKKAGSIIMPQKERSVIVQRREGSVIMPKKEGSVILKRKEGSVINGSVIRAPVGYPGERIVQRTVMVPREKMVLTPRERIVTSRERPQTVSVTRSDMYGQPMRVIPEGGRMAYVAGGTRMPERYVTQRVLVRNSSDLEPEYQNNLQRIYKTTINVASSDSDSSSDGPKEVVKTRYISSPFNRFKNVKGVPAAKMYIPSSNMKPSKNSNDDSDRSSLDSVDIKTFEHGSKKNKSSKNKKK